MGEMNVRGLVEIVQERAASDDPLVLLEAAIVVAGEASGAADDLIEHYFGAARAVNVSWTLTGERLGVSKQAARQKFAPRLQVSDVISDVAETMVMARGYRPVCRRPKPSRTLMTACRASNICCSGSCMSVAPPASSTGSA